MKVINWDMALEQVGGDEDFLTEVLHDLITEATQAVKEIEGGIDSGSFETVMHSAHRIKGGASYLYCDELREISLQLQECGRRGMNGEGNWGDIRKKFSRYVEALESLQKEASSRK